MSLFTSELELLDQAVLSALRGTITEVRGLAARVRGLHAPVGAVVRFESDADRPAQFGEIVGFQGEETIILPYGATTGLRRGDRVLVEQNQPTCIAGPGLLGRVVNALGQPIDDAGPLRQVRPRSLTPPPLTAMHRPLIDTPLATGVRAVDTLLTAGRGQRLGVFAPPGVGKSTLLAMMARGTAADVSVVALIGERGREVREFIDNQLGEAGMKKAVVVVSTGDESPLLRIRAALTATAIAESFRDDGKDVLLIMDSLTRFCQAQRQVGLAAGEPPATKGFTPSVFAMLPVLLERSGRTARGSITGFYAVLMEGEDVDDPVADAARGVLDGHIALSRKLGQQGHWPAIDIVRSISRVADEVTDPQHQLAAHRVRRLIAAYEQVEDLLNIGAYANGSNEDFDLAIAARPAINQMLQQSRGEVNGLGDFERSRKQLLALAQSLEQLRKRAVAGGGARPAGPGANRRPTPARR